MGCYYEWSTQELPELSESLENELTKVGLGVEARAYAFGEDCVEASGTTTFLPMETDFQVMIPVSSLTDEARLGAWIKTVLAVIGNIPPGQLSGPQAGRVAFEFRSEGAESLRLTVSLSEYSPDIRKLQDGALLRHFRPAQ